jgi:pteridine reductase
MEAQDNEWRGRVALLTGGARRVGAAIARRLHGSGLRLVLHYRQSEAEAQALQRELEAVRPDSVHLLRADLLDTPALPQMARQAVAAFGRVDALINNASTFYPTPVGAITEAHWDDLMGSNLKAPLFLSQVLAGELQARRGCIVNLADIHAARPLRRHTVYCAAKAGLVMLTQSLARELGPAVRVNAVSPGAILLPEAGMDDAIWGEIISRTALKRAGGPDDIARAVLFLLRDAPYVTGQVLPVDGGRNLAM